MLLWERVAPSHVGKGGFASIMRVSGLVGLVGGFGWFYSRSIRACSALLHFQPRTGAHIQLGISERKLTLGFADDIERFYGFTENKREVEMDMREMVDKVKKGSRCMGIRR